MRCLCPGAFVLPATLLAIFRGEDGFVTSSAVMRPVNPRFGRRAYHNSHGPFEQSVTVYQVKHKKTKIKRARHKTVPLPREED